jgi:hypothetical protein
VGSRDAVVVLPPQGGRVLHDGDQFGPVGGRIVGEVLVGSVDADPESFGSVDPNRTPTLPARRASAFGLGDVVVPVH